jgi:hypothetical protein
MNQLSHKLEVLKQHCQEIGRPYEDIEKTALTGVDITTAANDPKRSLETAKELRSLGIEHAIYANSRDADISSFAKFADTVQSIHEL